MHRFSGEVPDIVHRFSGEVRDVCIGFLGKFLTFIDFGVKFVTCASTVWGGSCDMCTDFVLDFRFERRFPWEDPTCTWEKRDIDLFGGVLIYCATDSDIESRRVRLGAMKLKICVSGKWIDLGHPYAFHKFILAEPPTFACLSNKFPCQNVNSMPFLW